MKHIELFENFGDMYYMPKDLYKGEPVLIGYYGESGYLSHPAVFTPEVAQEIQDRKDFRIFIPTSKEQSLPQALVCIFHNDDWTIKGITRTLAQSIMTKIGGDHLDGYNKDHRDLIEEIASMVGYRTGGNPEANISIIMNPQLNTVYWSDAPERKHSYWEPPYQAIPVEDLMD